MTLSTSEQQHGYAASGPAFVLLDVYPGVLRTPRTAIAVRAIARAAVVTDTLSRQVEVPVARDVWLIAKSAGPLALAVLVHAAAGWQAAVAAYAIAVIAGIVIFVVSSRPASKRESYQRYRLQLSTSDGVLTSFASDSEDFALRILEIVCERMDHDGRSAPALHINFERGTIETVPAGTTGVVNGATNGSGNGYAPAHGGAINGTSNASSPGAAGEIAGSGHAVHGVNGKSASMDTPAVQSRSQGAQLANGHAQGGATQAAENHYVDFTAFLPPVVDMHRFYARQQNTEHLEQRLHELELLMRSGAPGVHQKARIRELSADLSQILQAYPPVVQIFQNIAHIAGA